MATPTPPGTSEARTEPAPQVVYMPSLALEANEVNLFEYASILWGRKRFISLSCMGTGLIAIVLTLCMTNVYTASVLVKPANRTDDSGIQARLANQFGSLAGMAGISLGGDTSVKQAIATMQSYRFTQSFIEDENLTPVLFDEQWDTEKEQFRSPGWFGLSMAKLGAAIKGKTFDPTGLGTPTQWDAYALFRGEVLRIWEQEKEGLVTVSVTWKDPVLAAKWANSLVTRINREIRNADAVDAKKSIEYLRMEIEKTKLVNLRESLYHLIEEQLKTAMLTNVKEDYVFSVIDAAIPPQKKSAPKRGIIVILVVLFTGIIASGWVLMQHHLAAGKLS